MIDKTLYCPIPLPHVEIKDPPSAKKSVTSRASKIQEMAAKSCLLGLSVKQGASHPYLYYIVYVPCFTENPRAQLFAREAAANFPSIGL